MTERREKKFYDDKAQNENKPLTKRRMKINGLQQKQN